MIILSKVSQIEKDKQNTYVGPRKMTNTNELIYKREADLTDMANKLMVMKGEREQLILIKRN